MHPSKGRGDPIVYLSIMARSLLSQTNYKGFSLYVRERSTFSKVSDLRIRLSCDGYVLISYYNVNTPLSYQEEPKE